MKIYEAIKMLQKMNPNEDVYLQFDEDVTEYRNNEHLKKVPRPIDWNDPLSSK
jgi:hypothetical protein